MAECVCCGDEYPAASTYGDMCLNCNGAGCDPETDRCRRWW